MENGNYALFLDWRTAFDAGAQQVGGKGWNLARLVRYGFPVPAGGVLSVSAYEDFIRHNSLGPLIAEAASIPTVQLDDASIVALLDRLRRAVLRGSLPPAVDRALLAVQAPAVAVRSSAACEDGASASFAGMHDSFLNVRGPAQVRDAVRGCYASLWTPRAVAYRRRMGIPDAAAAMAVVIQEMVPAQAAGVAFSCDPANGDGDVIVVDAAFGLGEALVGGRIEPDRYVLDVVGFLPRIASRQLGAKAGSVTEKAGGGTEFRSQSARSAEAALSDDDLVRLAVLVGRVLEALGDGAQHQDVEWAFDGRDFTLLQARPVTGPLRRTYPALRGQPEVWSNANLRDVMPHVLSTLYWSSTRNMMELFLSAPLRVAGYRPLAGAQRIRLHEGRPYFNLSLLQWEMYDAFHIPPASVNETFGGHQPEIAVPDREPASVRLTRAGRLLRLALAFAREKRHAGELLGELERCNRQWETQARQAGSDAELADLIASSRELAFRFSTRALLLNISVGFSLGLLARALERSFPGRGSALANALLAGQAGITSAEHGLRLVELAELVRGDADARAWLTGPEYDPLQWEAALPEHSPFRRGFREFLDAYGHRGVYELDIMHVRWHEDPGYLLENVRALLDTADAKGVRDRQRQKAAETWAEIAPRLGMLRRPVIRALVRRAAADARLREAAKSALVRISSSARAMCEEMGKRLTERGLLERVDDVYHCTRMELLGYFLCGWDAATLKLLVAERKAKRAELERLTPPDLVVDGTARRADPPKPSAKGAITGMGVAAGHATGIARILRHPSEAARLGHGDVLVAPSTDPAWTPLFLRAAAVVMETGGQLSHGAIVAREYGIPAVVNIPGVLGLLRDGARVCVDGDAGEVHLLETPEDSPLVEEKTSCHAH